MKNETSAQSTGIIFAVIGVILFSVKAILVKLAYQYPVSSEHLLLFRMLFALPFYLAIALWNKPDSTKKITRADYIWVIVFGFTGYYLASYFDFLGLQYIKAGLERIILFIYPTLVLILSALFLKKRITQQQMLAIVITYIGVCITFWADLEIKNNDNQILGAGLIFLAAFTYAVYITGSGWLIPKLGVIQFTSYAMIVAALTIISQYLLLDRGDIFSYPLPVYLYGFAMAIFATILPSYLVSAAIARIGASNFSIIGSLGPISTIILAYFFLNEKFTSLQMVGSLIVILGIYIVTHKKNKS